MRFLSFRRVFLLILCASLVSVRGPAQAYSRQMFGIESGLLHNRIDYMVQDSMGYLWISNGLGLSRYDGSRFTNYKPEEPYSNGFGLVSEIQCPRSGEVIYPVAGGITRFQNGRFSYSRMDTLALQKYDKYGRKSEGSATALFDRWGNFWCPGEMLYKFDGVHTYKISDPGNLPPATAFRTEFIDEQKNFWVVATDGFHKYNGQHFEWIKIHPDSNYVVFSAYTDKLNRTWFLSHSLNDLDNVTVFLYEHGELKNMYHPFQEYGPFTGGIAEDEHGDMWFSCVNGLLKFHGHFFERGGIVHGVKKLKIDGRQSLIAYNEKQIYVREASGIYDIKVSQNLGNDIAITSMLIDRENIIWVGTTDGLLKLTPTNVYYYNFNPLNQSADEKNSPRLILSDSRGRKWIYHNGQYTIRGEDTIQVGREVTGEYASIAEDALGHIWLATANTELKGKKPSGGGLWLFESLHAHRVEIVGHNNALIAEPGIEADPGFFKDSKKRLWIASHAGMICIENKKAALARIDTAKTRFDIYSLLTEDRKGNLFLINHRNVFRFDEKAHRFESYFKSSNIPEGQAITIVFDKFDHAWFADYRGFLINWDGEGEHVYTFQELGITGNFTLVGFILPTVFLSDNSGDLWLGTSTCGLYQIIAGEKGKKPEVKHFNTNNGLSGSIIHDGMIDHKGNLWILTNYGLNGLNIADYHKTGQPFFRHTGIPEGLHDLNANNLEIDYSGNLWMDAGVGDYYKIDLSVKVNNPLEPNTFLTEFVYKNKDKEVVIDSFPKNLILSHTQNSISISFIGISLSYPEKVRYKYMLEGFDAHWQKESSRSFVSYSNLPSGHYTFKVMACNNDGVWNTVPASYSFEVLGPWYLSWYAILGYVLAIGGSIFGYSGVKTKALRERQKILEQTVNERTSEIVKQKQIIEVKNHEITDSINYAQRIQRAILPPLDEINDALTHSFVLFKPKDIVSGDFYWFSEKAGMSYIAAADCTGHGVPGGFMSMIGTEKLNEALHTSSDVSELLSLVNINLKHALRQSGKENSTRDGMDIAVCAFNREMTYMEYAGANRPLWILRKNNPGELEEFKATKMAIGGLTPDNQEFTRNRIELHKGDTVYLSTDGFADQFGRLDKKMMTRKFKDILLGIQDQNMEEQKRFLDDAFEDWKGAMEQTDDVLVIGVRV
jgi:ligand-binding sensor domain-containing protein/serine phosphatase RsbU (regulator of sigma subunit)